MSGDENTPTPTPFDYKTFHDENLCNSIQFASESIPLNDFELVNIARGANDGNQKFTLALKPDHLVPVFHMSGEILTANIAPKQACRNRPQNRETRLDRYLIRVQVPSSDYKPMVKNADSIIEFWKSQHQTLLSIADSAHSTETTAELEQRIELAFHGLITTNEFVLTRNVARPKPRDPPTPRPTDMLLPDIESQELMKKPEHFQWRSTIPIYNDIFDPIDVTTTDVIDKTTDVYFQFSQGYWSNKIHIQPEPIALHISFSQEPSPHKKARLSILF